MKIGAVVIRIFEFEKSKKFWQQALNYVPKYPPTQDWVHLRDPKGEGPDVTLDRIDEKYEGKRGKLHLDFYSENQEEEVERLIQLGAKKYEWDYKGDHPDYVVLEDPDGNLFCVVQT